MISGDLRPEKEHHWSRDRGGTHPSRILRVRNVENPLEPGSKSGKPTARGAYFSSGNRMAQEANAGGSKDQRKTRGALQLPGITRRIRVDVARPERELTWAR